MFDSFFSPAARSPLPLLAWLRAAGGALRRFAVAVIEVAVEAQEMRHEMRRRHPRVWHI